MLSMDTATALKLLMGVQSTSQKVSAVPVYKIHSSWDALLANVDIATYYLLSATFWG